MTYHYHLYESPEAVDADAWNIARQEDASPFTDLRFLRVVQTAMKDEATCWPVLIRDEQDRPAAVACLSLFHIDATILSNHFLQRVTSEVRRFWPNYMRLRILVCGLPVSTGHSSLFIRETADADAVCAALKNAIDEVEQRERPALTIVKEFDDDQAGQLQALTSAGFLHVDSLPMHELPGIFADFDEYYRGQPGKRRYDIRKSRGKLEKSGIQVLQMRGGKGALDYLTEDAHSLYVAVYEKSQTKFEFLSLEFFRELARQFPEESWYTFLLHQGRVVAFCANLTYRHGVHLLFLGIDYSLNRQADLYFNTVYQSLSEAFASRPETVFVGQNSSAFKLKLGCRQTRRTLFARGRGAWRPLLRLFAPLVFPKVELQPSRLEARKIPADHRSPASSRPAEQFAEPMLPSTSTK